MDLGLKGKTALVAAASGGLGRAVAEELATEGASLILCSRKAETINHTASEIATATGADILALPCDVSKADEVARLVQSGIARFATGSRHPICGSGFSAASRRPAARRFFCAPIPATSRF